MPRRGSDEKGQEANGCPNATRSPPSAAAPMRGEAALAGVHLAEVATAGKRGRPIRAWRTRRCHTRHLGPSLRWRALCICAWRGANIGLFASSTYTGGEKQKCVGNIRYFSPCAPLIVQARRMVCAILVANLPQQPYTLRDQCALSKGDCRRHFGDGMRLNQQEEIVMHSACS